MQERDNQELLTLTAQIVAAHIGRTKVEPGDLPFLIQTVYGSLAKADEVQDTPELQAPAVPWKKSVFQDFIICLEDGKRLKMLKRYLKSSYNLTPQEYRAKWSLPKDYPMVAPAYASRRSELAKSSGLGRKPASPTVTIGPARRSKGSKG